MMTATATETAYRIMIRAIGAGFHPDTRGEEYASLPDGYSPDRVEEIIENAETAGVDLYGIALDEIHAIDSDDRYDRSPTLDAEARYAEEQISETITMIARNVLGIDSLSEQGRDSLDFHEVSVVAIREALAAAFAAGRKAPR